MSRALASTCFYGLGDSLISNKATTRCDLLVSEAVRMKRIVPSCRRWRNHRFALYGFAASRPMTTLQMIFSFVHSDWIPAISGVSD